MKHIYSNTKEGSVKIDKVEADMYILQSSLLTKQKKRSVNRFAITLFVALLLLVFAIAVHADIWTRS
jgi:hypothetical protein